MELEEDWQITIMYDRVNEILSQLFYNDFLQKTKKT